jgi:hypothetical protein
MLPTRRDVLITGCLMLLAVAGACAKPAAPASTAGPPHLRLRVDGSSEALVLDGRVAGVREVRDPERDGIALSVDLDETTRTEVRNFTGRHVGDHVDIEVGGKTVATLVVRDPVDVPALLLTSKDDADVREMERELGGR